MNTPEKIPCGACENGHYEEVITRYEAKAADDVQVVIPKAKILRCVKCGDELIPPETQEEIDRAVAEQSEQLSQLELEDISDTFGLDQTETSEVLGLGSKTFHRWLKGTQFPSRSMGYYLRILAEFPEAFEWLRERGWRKRNRVFETVELSVQFPDLAWAQKHLPPELHKRMALRPAEKGTAGGFNPATLFRKTRLS